MNEVLIFLCGILLASAGGVWLWLWIRRDMHIVRTMEQILLALSKSDDYGMTSRMIETELDRPAPIFHEAVQRLINDEYITAREATRQEVIRFHNLETKYGSYAIDRANFMATVDRLFKGSPNMLLRLTAEGRSVLPA